MKGLSKLIGLIMIAFIMGCEKDSNIGTESVEVTVNFHEFGGEVNVIEGLELTLKVTGEESYIYKKKTDVDGQVVFTLLKEGLEYTVSANYEKDGIPYSGEIEVKAGTDLEIELELIPLTDKFNIVTIKCVDSNQAPVPDVDVCLFLSQILADSADCNASTYSGVTGNFGKVNWFNLQANNYYIGIQDTVGGHVIDHISPIVVQESGVQSFQIQVIP